ncbi:hypothetical protein [Demequina aurantiaca]|uniref:hypothetical protein n=1 Tax=Demequina aurantiaca TaxID=676200 RepID=UPI003D341AE6
MPLFGYARGIGARALSRGVDTMTSTKDVQARATDDAEQYTVQEFTDTFRVSRGTVNRHPKTRDCVAATSS